jgi:hypothetical protein
MTANDFRVGDSVESSYGAHGRIYEIKDGVVRATYRERGGSWVESYNEHWFNAYPEMLKKVSRGGRVA